MHIGERLLHNAEYRRFDLLRISSEPVSYFDRRLIRQFVVAA